GTRCARSPSRRWPTSTPTTSTRPPGSSPAPPGRWASPSRAEPLHDPRGRTRAGPDDHTLHSHQGAPMKRSKAYRASTEKIEDGKLYPPLEAVRLAKDTSTTKYDATVEVALRLGVDPRKADQLVRGTVNLPHGTGKTARVLVFANGDKAEAAREAG